MTLTIPRRAFVVATGAGFLGLPRVSGGAPATGADLYDGFPAQDPALVREVVGKSHSDIDAVRALVTRSPALARAAIDWGFGDWESALGAASHTGRREIAELLIAHGARPDLFTHAMLGHLDVVRAAVEAVPGIQRMRGPHSFSLLHHARAGREPAAAVAEYLESLGDADLPTGEGEATEAELEGLTGVYAYGDGEDERLVVTLSRGRFQIQRPPGFGRGLVRVGDGVFHPAGAESVRVAFARDGAGRVTGLTVHDPDPVVVARWLGRD